MVSEIPRTFKGSEIQVPEENFVKTRINSYLNEISVDKLDRMTEQIHSDIFEKVRQEIARRRERYTLEFRQSPVPAIQYADKELSDDEIQTIIFTEIRRRMAFYRGEEVYDGGYNTPTVPLRVEPRLPGNFLTRRLHNLMTFSVRGLATGMFGGAVIETVNQPISDVYVNREGIHTGGGYILQAIRDFARSANMQDQEKQMESPAASAMHFLGEQWSNVNHITNTWMQQHIPPAFGNFMQRGAEGMKSITGHGIESFSHWATVDPNVTMKVALGVGVLTLLGSYELWVRRPHVEKLWTAKNERAKWENYFTERNYSSRLVEKLQKRQRKMVKHAEKQGQKRNEKNSISVLKPSYAV